jgi:hypothetical protein
MKKFKVYLLEQKCPIATTDMSVNIQNRQNAIDNFGYGPANPNDEEANNKEFWNKKAKMWNIAVEDVKTMKCGNCGAFDISDKMRACIEGGIEGDNEGVNSMATIEKSDLGYCNFLHFKCAGDRTCDAWVANGPIDNKDRTE